MIKTPRNLTKNVKAGCIMARIMRNKIQHSKNFSLAEHGSWEKAEEAAINWLEEIKGSLPPPMTSKNNLTSRNVSGFVGVTLKASKKRSKNYESTHYAWHAFWPENPNGTRWAVEKYGDDQAFVRAVLSRQLESTDRNEIQANYEKVHGTKLYDSILSQKALDLV
jgi:hypothetical protein